MRNTNATLSPEIKGKCNGCMNDSCGVADNPCNICARNNLSGYYEDLFVDESQFIKECK